jgi:hypothetical protein
MARKKSLNVMNTDRLFNLNLTTKQEESNFTKVTRINEKEIEKRLDKLKSESTRFNKRDKKSYMLYKQRYSNDTIQEMVFNHGGHVFYYTNDRVPIPVINQLASVPQSEIIYLCRKDYSLDDVMNVQLASMATKVSLDVPIVLPDINPYDYLFSLYPLRYHVDKVKISFPSLNESEIQDRHKDFYVFYNGMYHLKSKYKYECFKRLQEPLSCWKMNIWLVCDSERDLQTIEDLVMRDNKRFKPTQGGSDDDN